MAWNRARSTALIDEGQFVLVDRILTHPEAQGVKRRVAFVVTLDDGLEAQLAHEV